MERGIADKALPHLVRSPMFAFEKKSKRDAWRKLPVTHVLTQQDYSVSRPCQDLMLEKVRNKCVVARSRTMRLAIVFSFSRMR